MKAPKLQQVQTFEDAIFWVKELQDYEPSKLQPTPPKKNQMPKTQKSISQIDLKLSPKKSYDPWNDPNCLLRGQPLAAAATKGLCLVGTDHCRDGINLWADVLRALEQTS